MVVEHWAARGVVAHQLYTLLQPEEGAAGSREVSESCGERRGKEWTAHSPLLCNLEEEIMLTQGFSPEYEHQ